MEIIRRIGGVLSVIEKASAGLAALTIFALMMLVVIDVTGRKFFNSPLQGTIEVASLALPVIVFLGIAYIQSLNEHVTVDLFTAGLSEKTKLALDMFCLGIGIAIMVVIVFKLTGSAWSSTVSREYTMGIVEVPTWPARVLVAYGSWLFGLRLVCDFIIGGLVLFAPNSDITTAQIKQ